MRALLFASAVFIAGGIGTSAIRSLLQPNSWYAVQERLLAQYRTDPESTLSNLAASYLRCVDSKHSGTSGASKIRALAAKIIVEVVTARIQGLDETEFEKRRIELFQRHVPDIARKVDENDVDSLLAYLKNLGEDRVTSCVVSSSV